ncbi:MAG: glycosyltransferase family 4 protein [Candidatus Zixiibacteriota bacterium]
MDNRLNILYISHYFPPEVNAPALRVSEMAASWIDSGADVTVLTGFPNHPNGIIPERYKGLKSLCENFGKIKLVRTYLYAAPNKGFAKRILNYLSFMFSSVILGIRKIGKPDILIATSPQFFVAVAGYVISRIKRCRFIFEVRDVWPEEIVAVGAIKNRLVIKALEALEMSLYRKADLVVAVAQGTIDILTKRGIPRSKLALIPNGVNIDHFQDSSSGAIVRKELGLENDFVVTYLGTHGMAHKLETILESADKLRQHRDIKFLFVGDGAEKSKLVSRAAQMNLSNVIFHDQVDRERIPGFYHASDLFLVPLRKAKLFTKNVPSKVYEIMAARKPIIISTEGESRRLIESAGAGMGAAPEDAADIADKILRLYMDEGLRRKMGQDGYSFVLANASRKRLADEYLQILESVVSPATIDQEAVVVSETEEDVAYKTDIGVPA